MLWLNCGLNVPVLVPIPIATTAISTATIISNPNLKTRLYSKSSTQRSQSTSFPAQFITTTLPNLSPTITRKWMTSAGFSDQALWPPGPTIRGSGDTVFRVFLGEAVNISTGEDCLENPAASRSGARLAEERGRQTGAWPQIVVAIERSHYRQR